MNKYIKTEWAKNNIVGSAINMDKIENKLVEITDEIILAHNNMSSINSSLEYLKKKTRIIEPTDFGKIDGINDTQTMESMFLNMGDNVIINLNKDIILKKPISTSFSNITLNCNGYTIFYDGNYNLDNNNAIDRYYGALNFVGQKLEQLAITSCSYVKYIDSTLLRLYCSTENLKEGDYVYFNISSGDTWQKDYSDIVEGTIGTRKIINKGDGYIEVAHDCPYDVTTFTNNKLFRINPSFNIKINDFKFHDNGSYVYDVGEDYSQRSSWVSGIVFWRCINVQVNTPLIERNKFPGIFFKGCANFHVFNGKCHNPTSLGGGCGYFTQISSSNNGLIEECEGIQTRHVVDCSGSNHITVRGCKEEGFRTNWSFDLHGINEHDILFQNCIGNFKIGNGIQNFPMSTANITVDNCKFYKTSIDGNRNIRITNCEYFGLGIQRGAHHLGEVKIENSKIYGNASRWYGYGSNRGRNYNLSIDISNSDIIYTDYLEDLTAQSSDLFGLHDFEEITLNNCKLKTDLVARKNISLGAKYVFLDNNKFNDIFVSTPNNLLNSLYVRNNLFKTVKQINGQTYVRAIDLDQTQVNNLFVSNNRFFGGMNTSLDWLRHLVQIKDGGIVLLTDNVLYNGGELLADNYLQLIGTNGKSVNNVLKNYTGQILK